MRTPVWRRQPGIDELLRWLALVLPVANLVNKQAFYNQFWLVGALVAASLALPQGEPAEPGVDGEGLGTRAVLGSAGTRRQPAQPGEPRVGELGPGGVQHRHECRVGGGLGISVRPVDAPALTTLRRAASPWSCAIISTACQPAR